MNIILIDDTPDHLELLAEFIGELRPNASIARLRDGMELPRHLDQCPADLVLVDLMMPSISGYELVRQVREAGRWPNLPIIAVSGMRKPDQPSEMHRAGFNDYIVKPYELSDLARVLDRHLPPSE